MKNKITNLSNAYSLNTPKDSIKLYKSWAKTYDEDFAKYLNYLSPLKITNYFKKNATINDQPILDVGAGTGLLGELLYKINFKNIIGIDISEEMLKEARLKNCYSSLIRADLTKKIPMRNESVGAIVSTGTFTHGHIGPETLDELLRIIKPNGLFILSIHSELFNKGGFKKKFIEIKNKITIPSFKIFKIYGKNQDKKHGNDKAYAAIFRKY